MSEAPFKRTQYLVDRKYQLRFVTRIFLMIFVIAVLTSIVATGTLWVNLYNPDLARQTTLVAALTAVTITLLVELLLAIPIVFYLGIRQSHRVVGPIKRIKATLEAIGTGDFSQRIHLRKSDVLIDLADSINTMADSLQRRTTSSGS